MAVSTHKKILVRRFERDTVAGFVNPQSYLQPSGVEVLNQEGTLLLVPYDEIKALFFVRDFGATEAAESRLFNARPKMNGLWVRLRFRDGEIMDGLLPNNLLQLGPYGFTFVPPSPSSNNQKVFVPRAALSELQVLGVVGSPLRPRKRRPKEQIELFE